MLVDWGHHVAVGRCHWEGMLTGLRQIHKELTTGRFVDRTHRADEVVSKMMEKFGVKDEQGNPVRSPGR